MSATLVPGVLTCGIFDQEFRPYAPGLTAHQSTLPPTFAYLDNEWRPNKVDLVIATYHSAMLLLDVAPTSTRRVLWLQESRALYPHPPLSFAERFDLVLTNDAAYAALLGTRARWLAPIGTWLDPDVPPTPKICSCSFLAKRHDRTVGQDLRQQIAHAAFLGLDVYGEVAGQEQLSIKDPVLRPYRFHVAVENDAYPHYVTEKLFDAFATRTVPVYWGSPDLVPLAALGFDVSGILPFATLDDLAERLAAINRFGDQIYAELASAIEANHAAISHYRVTETLLETVLRDAFDLR